MGAIKTTFKKHTMDLHLTDPGSASGTKLAHLVVEQGPPASAHATSQPSSTSSTAAPSTSTSTSSKPANRMRRFVCTFPECDKTFTTSGHLARHIRVHTGEKAFQCTFPGCESRFSRHDNMLQHYRNHIVRNARRRKKAFASAVANGNVGLTSREPYDDAPPGSNRPQAASPVFVHSTYSTLSQAGGHPHHQHQHGSASSSGIYSHNSNSLRTSTSSIPRRGPSVSPLLGPTLHPQGSSHPSSSSSSSRPPHLNLSLLDPRNAAAFAGPLTGGSSTSYAHLSPPLASPSVMDRPHTATTSFFPGVEGLSIHPHPPPLTHRHSYSALGNQPVLEPITPTSELPHYPYHQYPTSPGIDPRGEFQYSPTLTASPGLLSAPDGSTPTHEHGQYFQSLHGSGSQLYADRYGPPTTHPSASTHHSHHAVSSSSYPPNHPHSQTGYLLHPHSSAGSRNAVSHSSLGSHNPLLSGLPLGGNEDPSLSTSTRSTSLASSTAHHMPSLAEETAAGVEAAQQYTTQPPSTSVSPAPRWLRGPNEGTENHYHRQHLHNSNLPVHGHGWQPDVSREYVTAIQSNSLHLSASMEEDRAYRQALMDEHNHNYQEAHAWTPYGRGS